MKNLLRIRIACDILTEIGLFDDAQCIAILNWNSVPEAAKQVSCTIGANYKVTLYKINNTSFVDIVGYGLFQIV